MNAPDGAVKAAGDRGIVVGAPTKTRGADEISDVSVGAVVSLNVMSERRGPRMPHSARTRSRSITTLKGAFRAIWFGSREASPASTIAWSSAASAASPFGER